MPWHLRNGCVVVLSDFFGVGERPPFPSCWFCKGLDVLGSCRRGGGGNVHTMKSLHCLHVGSDRCWDHQMASTSQREAAAQHCPPTLPCQAGNQSGKCLRVASG